MFLYIKAFKGHIDGVMGLYPKLLRTSGPTFDTKFIKIVEAVKKKTNILGVLLAKIGVAFQTFSRMIISQAYNLTQIKIWCEFDSNRFSGLAARAGHVHTDIFLKTTCFCSG